MCIWKCLVIANWIRNNQARLAERTTRDALKLTHEFYSNPKLFSDVRSTKLIDFSSITSRIQVNIMLYESMNQSAWRRVFGEVLDSSVASSVVNNVDIGLYEGHCFYI